MVLKANQSRKENQMKKHSKILSLFLASVLLLSSVCSAFVVLAQENYKPDYSETVTEEDVTALIGDVNTILNENVLTGSSIESIYKVLPKIKSILMLEGSSAKASDKGVFYKLSQPERFADLPDGQIIDDVFDEDGNLVTEGTFTAFFKEHPIVCETAEDFQKELNILVDTIVVKNIIDTLPFAFLMAGSLDAGVALGDGLDEVCTALGINQEKKAADVMGFNLMTGIQADMNGTRDYLKNIIAAILPDTANSVIDMLQSALAEGNAQKLYSGVTKILNSLNGCVTGLSSTLKELGVDIASVQQTIADIQATFAALPTTGEDANKKLDIQGIVGYVVADLTSNAVGIKFGPNGTANGIVKFEFTEMNLDRIVNAESNADVVKIVYDYLYNNIIGNDKTNSTIEMAISSGIIEEALGVTLEEDLKTALLDALKMENDELSYELIAMVADMAGRELPEKPAEPVDPTDPTDPAKPSEPGKTDPSNNDNSKNQSNTSNSDASNSNLKNSPKTVKSAVIPNTGAIEAESAVAYAVIITAAVIVLAFAAYSLKKKAENR